MLTLLAVLAETRKCKMSSTSADAGTEKDVDITEDECYDEAAGVVRSLYEFPMADGSDCLCGTCTLVARTNGKLHCRAEKECPAGTQTRPVYAMDRPGLYKYSLCDTCPRNYRSNGDTCVRVQRCKDSADVYDAAAGECRPARFHEKMNEFYDVENTECAVYESSAVDTTGASAFYTCVAGKTKCLEDELTVELPDVAGVSCTKDSTCPPLTVKYDYGTGTSASSVNTAKTRCVTTERPEMSAPA